MEEELGLVGATADDTEAELVRSICEKELLDGKKARCMPLPQVTQSVPNLDTLFHQALRYSLPLFHCCLKSATTLAHTATQSSLQLLLWPLASSA